MSFTTETLPITPTSTAEPITTARHQERLRNYGFVTLEGALDPEDITGLGPQITRPTLFTRPHLVTGASGASVSHLHSFAGNAEGALGDALSHVRQAGKELGLDFTHETRQLGHWQPHQAHARVEAYHITRRQSLTVNAGKESVHAVIPVEGALWLGNLLTTREVNPGDIALINGPLSLAARVNEGEHATALVIAGESTPHTSVHQQQETAA